MHPHAGEKHQVKCQTETVDIIKVWKTVVEPSGWACQDGVASLPSLIPGAGSARPHRSLVKQATQHHGPNRRQHPTPTNLHREG